ncbi:hypothetical protein ES703_91590 [subsurface metagenome]
MINNDYIRGYFDAHGRVYVAHNGRRYPQYVVEFQDRDQTQLGRVNDYLLKLGYSPSRYTFRHASKFGEAVSNKIHIGKGSEVECFAKEIGTERPEWQERFDKFLETRQPAAPGESKGKRYEGNQT